MTDEQIAQLFHEQYELLAPSFSYSTREESRKPWADVPPENKALMVAVCGKVREELMRSTIAAPAQEPAYPEGEVVGPCVCGSWPGGKCFKCPRVAAAAQEAVAYLSRDGKNSMTVRDFKEHLNNPRWRWVIEKYWTDAIPLGPISAAPASTAAPVVPEGFVRHPVEQVTVWADMYTREGGHALIVQMLRTYAAMLAAAPKPDA